MYKQWRSLWSDHTQRQISKHTDKNQTLQTKLRPYHLLVVYNPSTAAHTEQQNIYLIDSCGGPVHERYSYAVHRHTAIDGYIKKIPAPHIHRILYTSADI